MSTDAPQGPHNGARGKQVTLRDIAKELGVSHVTVSLALRDHPRISNATRERVKDKAEEMGYHPDPMLSALSHYRLTSKEKPVQATLAWINPLRKPEKLWEFEEFVLYRKGAEAIARHLGFHIEEFRSEELSLQRMDSIFKARGIRGLLLSPLAWDTADLHWDDLPWQDYAGVRFGGSRAGPQLHYITSAQATNTMLAFENTQRKGYSRIGFFGSAVPRRMFDTGFLRAQQELPKELQIPMVRHDNHSPDELRSMLSGWIKAHRPEAIITDHRYLPSLLADIGYRVPEDIGIVTTTIHDTPIDTGIDQNPEEIGRAAVRMLASLINEHHLGVPEIRTHALVEGRWIEGSMLPDRT